MGEHIITKAGVFELECSTYGAPLWVHIRIRGQEVDHTFIVADDLHDLIHAAQRMLQKTEAGT